MLDLSGDGDVHAALDWLSTRPISFGVRLDDSCRAVDLPDNVGLVVVDGDVPEVHCDVWVQVTSVQEAQRAIEQGAQGLVAKGREASGRVGTESTFVLLQRLLALDALPVWAQGGIGEHTAAAAIAGGAAGVVLQDQLALLKEAADVLRPELRQALASMDGSETAVVDDRRVYVRPGPLHDAQLPCGQDASFAADLAKRYRTVRGTLTALRRAVGGHLGQASAVRPHLGGSAFCAQHGLQRPVVQGPMTRVSDTAAFADAVAGAGGLPFVALSLLTGERLDQLLQSTAERLDGRPWGVGMLGFAPPELRAEQLAAVRAVRPPVALLAGGRPAQARALEDDGIPTYLHVPSPGLLDLFLREGARRFVFEGSECGGHVGPRSSFVLWEQAVRRLLQHDAVHELSVIFAGGIHDARSAAMVSALAAPLAAHGARIGWLMGTAYLFTEEAVQTGAIGEVFQEQALACARTRLLHTAPGHATRCAETAFVQAFDTRREQLQAEGAEPEQVWEALERLNLGRLRIASKGLKREGDELVEVAAEGQRSDGLFMIGQVAALRGHTVTLDELHRDVTEGADAVVQAAAAREQERDEAERRRRERPDDVAIVGMAAIFPDAPDLGAFWSSVVHGHDAVTEVPAERWNVGLYYGEGPGKSTSKWGGFLPEVDFDPLEYGIPPTSVAAVDPSQLLALEVAARALRDAGLADGDFDRERASVVFGAEAGTDLASAYGMRALLPQYVGQVPEALDAVLPSLTEDSFPGVLGNVIAGRIANRLDLGGVNYTVDAACASSLAALDVAVKELRAGSSDLVIAGGVDTHNAIGDYLLFSSVHALSPTGRSRPFDASADGIALGEGVAAVVCKRLADAVRDGDRIYAVIRGVAGSSDGRSLGLTAPRRQGQARALDRAYAAAGTDPGTLGLVEAHGTGTVVGDRTELQSLTDVFTEAGTPPGSITLGSVKSNVGHTKCAAGLAGLIKVALAIHHRVLPPTVHVSQPNSAWQPTSSPFTFRDQAAPWLAEERAAAVSAFGFGGTNFHAVLAQAPSGPAPTTSPLPDWPAELFVLPSMAHAEQLLAWLQQPGATAVRLADIAAAVHAWSPSDEGAIALVARHGEELRQALQAVIDGNPTADTWVADPAHPAHGAAVAWLFPGQGSQRPGMLAELFVAFPQVRPLLQQVPSLQADWFAGQAFDPAARQRQRHALTVTHRAQPALGIAGLAAAQILSAAGLRPQQLGGHSYGEIVALTVAGALPASELGALSEARGRCMQRAATGPDPGAMAAVAAGSADVSELLVAHPDVGIANDNGPGQTVIAGPTPAVAAATEQLQAAGFDVRPVPVAAAFHSPLVAGAAEGFAEVLADVEVSEPIVPTYSNVSAEPHEPSAIRERLAEHLARPVRFGEQVRAMHRDGARIFLEVGPGRVLTRLTGQILADVGYVALSVEPADGSGPLMGLLRLLGRLATLGHPVDLTSVLAGRTARPVDLTQPPPAPSPTTWRVNGHRAWPLTGPLPPHAMHPVPEPVAGGLGGAERDRVVMDYLRTLREQAEAQRTVMMSYLGQADPEVVSVAATAPVVEAPAPDTGPELPLADRLVALVSERTGYPASMLDLDLDLEADLSIDSIKRIEILGALSEQLQGASGGSPDEALVEELARVKTLRGIVTWLDNRTDSADGPESPAADAAAEAPEQALRFVPSLQPLQPPTTQEIAGRTVGLALSVAPESPGSGLLGELTRRLTEAGARVVAVGPGSRMPDVDVLVVLTGPLGGAPPAHNGTLGTALFDLACLARRALSGGVEQLVVVTGQGGELQGSDLAGVSGLVKTMAKEWPDASVRRVDLDPTDALAEQVALLLPEIAASSGPAEVGYRDGTRLGRTFTAHALQTVERTTELDADSVVLLTGGARGITARVATTLAERFGCTLVLVGRSPLPPASEDEHTASAEDPPQILAALAAAHPELDPGQLQARARRVLADRQVRQTLQALDDTDARWAYHSVDVRDESAVASLLHDVYDTHGRLDVVLHGAGVLEDKLLRDKTQESFLRVFDTKVTGAHNLVAHLQPDVRAVVFFSSVAGAFGNRGQADYAAANDALDQLAHELDRRLVGRALSIGWGPWGGSGMVSPELADLYRRRGIGLIAPQDGADRLIDELQRGREPQVVWMAAHPQQMA
ncbi:MAG: SDR family NAD(P)-dependent oxidoreductase [Myxococcales bacterium]|nr:SDR family NAD(P)-dependent oxidoreductase [Myxococcales bacterium]